MFRALPNEESEEEATEEDPVERNLQQAGVPAKHVDTGLTRSDTLLRHTGRLFAWRYTRYCPYKSGEIRFAQPVDGWNKLFGEKRIAS